MQRNRVGKGEPYFYLECNSLGTKIIVQTCWEFFHSDSDRRYDVGNYFTTFEDAVKAKERIVKALIEE